MANLELTDPLYWALFAGVVLFMVIRFRKKQPVGPTRGKAISIKGQQLRAHLGPNCPLACLFEDGKLFGPDYHDKTPPPLPHGPGCECSLQPNYRRADEIFQNKNSLNKPVHTEMGDLSPSELRYYKYLLIARHPDASKEQKEEYQELASRVEVDAAGRARIETLIQQGTT